MAKHPAEPMAPCIWDWENGRPTSQHLAANERACRASEYVTKLLDATVGIERELTYRGTKRFQRTSGAPNADVWLHRTLAPLLTRFVFVVTIIYVLTMLSSSNLAASQCFPLDLQPRSQVKRGCLSCRAADLLRKKYGYIVGSCIPPGRRLKRRPSADAQGVIE